MSERASTIAADDKPPVRSGAAAFIFVTILLDMLALGLILPILPKLVESFVDNDTARAARVTVCTRYQASMPALGGRAVDVIPIGIDTTLFPVAVRAEGPPWRLLRVASLNAVKDYPMLLRAMASIANQLPDAHLDIVGEDTLNGAVQAQCRALGLHQHVTFHGVQPTDALGQRLYGRAHVHVVSSRHEAASVAMLEAACADVPTVATRVGYAADWERDGRAIAVPVGDADALAAATVALIRNRERRAQIAAAARAWAIAHDADWTAAEFNRLYREVTR